jgi:hypothetical protein
MFLIGILLLGLFLFVQLERAIFDRGLPVDYLGGLAARADEVGGSFFES